jgi:hypothetical protein
MNSRRDTVRVSHSHKHWRSPRPSHRFCIMGKIAALVFAAPLMICGTSALAMVIAEDQKLIEEAGCDEIIKEHRNFAAAEQKLAGEIRRTSNSNTAGNVVGVATLAVFGLGFFHWDDQSDAKTNLAELKAYREAIAAEGRKKNCAM